MFLDREEKEKEKGRTDVLRSRLLRKTLVADAKRYSPGNAQEESTRRILGVERCKSCGREE